MALTVKELKEKLNEFPDDMDVIAIIGKEGVEGDVVEVKFDGAAILEVII